MEEGGGEGGGERGKRRTEKTHSSITSGLPQDFPPGSPCPVCIRLFFSGLLISVPVQK